MSFDFRKIQASDFNAVRDLLDTAFPIPRYIIERNLKEIAANPKAEGCIYGLYEKGTLIGTVTYGPCHNDDGWDGEGVIRYLAIHPDYRRRGHAKRIIERAITDLKAAACPCICVATHVDNTIATEIWEQFGFECYEDSFETDYGPHQGFVLWLEADKP